MDLNEISPELREQAKNCKTADELSNLASSAGVELTDEQLEAIAGGSVWDCDNNEGNASGT